MFKTLQKIIHFYTTAFDFKEQFIATDNSYDEIATSNTTIYFAAISLAKTNLTDGFVESSLIKKTFTIEIGFKTDNIEALIVSAANNTATWIKK